MRVSAANIETLVLDNLERHFRQPIGEKQEHLNNLLSELERVVLKPDAIVLHLMPHSSNEGALEEARFLSVPWTPQTFIATKGIARNLPEEPSTSNRDDREALLTAIAKARSWIQQLSAGGIAVGDISKQEGKSERQIRLLLPLAFLAPDMVSVIYRGAIRSGMTVTSLAQSLPSSWTTQAQMFC